MWPLSPPLLEHEPEAYSHEDQRPGRVAKMVKVVDDVLNFFTKGICEQYNERHVENNRKNTDCDIG